MEPIALPLWLFVLMVLLSVWALLERLLLPSVRWYLRRRVNRVIDEINTRLNVRIRPFQFTKRQVLVDRLVFDAKVLDALGDYVREQKVPREVAQAEVLRYAREIVPAFNAYAYFRVGYWLARRLAGLLYRVRANFSDPSRLAKVDARATVVFVMNHRSNMDYVLAAFLAAEQSALSYAVGEWARIWPLQQLVRAMGAYFVRRRSNNPLYRRVLERYVHMATEEGVCQAVFLEGRLSRDGRLGAPRLGILDYMLREHDPEGRRDIVFVPVGINYDRVLEDRTLQRALDSAAPSRSMWFVLRTTFGFVFHNLRLMLRSRWRRFGYAAVNFGQPMSVHAYCRAKGLDLRQLSVEERHAEIERLADNLMAAISILVPALPVPLAAATLLRAGPAGLSEFDWKAAFYRLAGELRDDGLFVVLPTVTEAGFEVALNALRLRRLVINDGDRWRVAPGEEQLVGYYANTLAEVGASQAPAAAMDNRRGQ